jgi:hypothetical protein
MPPRSAIPEADRFWAKVDRSGGPDACWPWLASSRRARYGQFRLDCHGPIVSAPRYAFESKGYPLAVGQDALHTCDNPPCCNPAHLFAGTQADNMADKAAKGRALCGEAIPQSKLTAAAVIRASEEAAMGRLQREIAADLGVTQTTISRIVRGLSWARLSMANYADVVKEPNSLRGTKV